MENKIEYRMIDHDMFDEDMIREMNSMGEKGWKIIRILDPMRWLNSDGMFIRVFYERTNFTRQKNKLAEIDEALNLIAKKCHHKNGGVMKKCIVIGCELCEHYR